MKLLRTIRARRPRPNARLAGLLAAAAVLAACDDPAPPTELTGSGSVAGLVFFDADEDGFFDPSDGDTPVEGVGLAVRNRGTSDVFAGATATTGADGRFSITGLPLGTHDLLVDESTVPTDVSICQNPIPFSVFLNETASAEVRGRSACLITIAEAKELALGSFVIIQGIVTSFPNQIDPSFTFIQDETAGTRIFSGVLGGEGIEIGDRIEIGGNTGAFSNDFNIEGDVALRALVEDVGELSPVTVTTGELSASGASFTDPIQGALIRLEAAELVAAFGDAPGGNEQNGVLDDGSGTTVIRVNDGVLPPGELNTFFSVGACYDIVGFGANFGGAGQIFPRSEEDIMEVPCN